MRPPFETFKKPICRGCYALGNACQKCEKCKWEYAQITGSMTHPKADGVTITCEKCGAFDWRPADGNGGGGGRGCICPKADGLDALKHTTTGMQPACSRSKAWREGWNDCIDHLAQRGMILQEGWVAVPIEPTRDMVTAAFEAQDHVASAISRASNGFSSGVISAYSAMLAAAPKMEGKE